MADLTGRIAERLASRLEPFARRAETLADDPVKSPRSAVVIGRLLGTAFLVCFATGVFSHLHQDPLPWLPMPARPAELYRYTQGLHVISGIAAVPLLLAKLWVVFPNLFEWPPARSFPHLLERAAIALLVAASLVEVTIGLLNIVQWYPFPFPFRATHFVLAWVVIGALLVHIGVKLPVIARVWRRPADEEPQDAAGKFVSRRAFVGGVAAAATSAVLLTAGQSVDALAPFNVFAPRRMGVGPQGLPVNRTAEQAGVTPADVTSDWSLDVATPAGTRAFSLEDLRRMPQTDVVLPIACVEGWSQSASWRGVRVVDLLAEVGAEPTAPLVFTSLQTRGAFRRTEMPVQFARDPLTLIALELNGSTLHLEHGYPARLIAPGRPGVMQTKWLSSIEVTA